MVASVLALLCLVAAGGVVYASFQQLQQVEYFSARRSTLGTSAMLEGIAWEIAGVEARNGTGLAETCGNLCATKGSMDECRPLVRQEEKGRGKGKDHDGGLVALLEEEVGKLRRELEMERADRGMSVLPEKEGDSLRKELERLKSESLAAQEERVKAEEEANARLYEAKKEGDDLRRQMEILERETERLRVELKEQGKAQADEEKWEAKAKEIAEMTEELQKLREELNDERIGREAVETREQEREAESVEVTKTVARLQSEADARKIALEEVQMKLDGSEKQQQILAVEMEELKGQVQALQSEAHVAQDNATAFAAELESERMSKSEVQAKLDRSDLEKHDLATVVDDLKDQVQRLKTKSDLSESEARSAQNNATELAASLESEQASQRELQARLDKSEREQHDLTTVVDDLKKEAERLKIEAQETEKAFLEAQYNATTLAASLKSSQARQETAREEVEMRLSAGMERGNAEEERVAEERDKAGKERQEEESDRGQRVKEELERQVANEHERAEIAERARAEAESALGTALEEKKEMARVCSAAELFRLEAEQGRKKLDEVQAKLDGSMREQHDLASVVEALNKEAQKDGGVCLGGGGQARTKGEVEDAMLELTRLREEREGERARMMELEELPRIVEILKAELEKERNLQEVEKRRRREPEKNALAALHSGENAALLHATRCEQGGRDKKDDEGARRTFEKEKGEILEEVMRLKKNMDMDRASLIEKDEHVQVDEVWVGGLGSDLYLSFSSPLNVFTRLLIHIRARS